jgi:Rrf2 family cysteine metabolism transcriptional repressor
MMFSTKAEYGVRVMVALAHRASLAQAAATADGGPADGACADAVVPLAEIAEHDGLPLAYLEHLVARLRKAGLIDSRRGARGGYMLARPASEITMAEVVEALEGSIAPIECISLGADGQVVCSRELSLTGHPAESSGAAPLPSHVCPTKLLWTRVRGSIVSTLQQTTLADLLEPTQPAPLPRAPSNGRASKAGPAAPLLTPEPLRTGA